MGLEWLRPFSPCSVRAESMSTKAPAHDANPLRARFQGTQHHRGGSRFHRTQCFVADTAGFEPATSPSGGERSIQLSYASLPRKKRGEMHFQRCPENRCGYPFWHQLDRRWLRALILARRATGRKRSARCQQRRALSRRSMGSKTSAPMLPFPPARRRLERSDTASDLAGVTNAQRPGLWRSCRGPAEPLGALLTLDDRRRRCREPEYRAAVRVRSRCAGRPYDAEGRLARAYGCNSNAPMSLRTRGAIERGPIELGAVFGGAHLVASCAAPA